MDDYLGLKSYGQVLLAPSAGLILIERRRPYREAPEFAYDNYANQRILTQIFATPVDAHAPLTPLFPQQADAGYWLGSLSPSGVNVSVFRIQRRHLSLGVIDLKLRTVKWLAATPDWLAAAPAPIWTDETHLLFVSRDDFPLPATLAGNTTATALLESLWSRQAAGLTSSTEVSSRDGAIGPRDNRRLIEIDLATGKDRTLFEGEIVDISLDPSRKRVAIVVAGKPVPPPPTPIGTGFESRRHALHIIDRSSAVDRIVPGDVLRGLLRWSACGRLLIVLRGSESDWSKAHYASVDTDGRSTILGGAAVSPVDGDGTDRPLVYAGWAGETPAALVVIAGISRWMRLLQGEAIPLAVAGKARPIGGKGAHLWLRDGEDLWDVGPRSIRRVSRHVSNTQAVLLDPMSRGSRPSQNPDAAELLSVGAVVRSVSPLGGIGPSFKLQQGRDILAIDRQTMVTRSADAHGVEELFVTPRGGATVKIDRINGELSDVTLATPVPLQTRDGTGKSSNHWLLLPAGAGPFPMIVVPYPGMRFGTTTPREAGISFFDVATNGQLLAAAGYAVLFPDMPINEENGHVSGAFAPQVEAAIRAASETGRIDADRVGIMGHSFGGYAALVLAEELKGVKAVVAANGPSDILSAHGMISGVDRVALTRGVSFANAGWAENGQGRMKRRPAQNGQAYGVASPVTGMDRIEAPVLLLTGDMDFVAMSQSEQAFVELAREGKDATLVRYWGENHTNASPGNIRSYWDRVVRFFDLRLRAGHTD
ncbi:alpha/beta hydrolase family protein [Sphingomonas faeni]|uniref:alpha/beta hydrolase family protein n=1 Tax=Sphingomonas faeni TaxID=185950 RepID=UPI003363DDCF